MIKDKRSIPKTTSSPKISQRLQHIRRFVGQVTLEQLRNVDYFLGDEVALFMPAVGPCYYAITPGHTHPAYSVFIPFDQDTVVEIEGAIMRPASGHFCTLSPDIPHHERFSGTFTHYIVVMIRRGCFERAWQQYTTRRPIFKGDITPVPQDMMLWLKAFMQESENPAPGQAQVLNALGTKIMHEFIRALCGFKPRQDTTSPRLEVAHALEHIRAHYAEDFSVEDLASHSALSPSHFSRVFKKEIGLSPAEYVIQVRLKQAKKMLDADRASMADIALACGFNTPSYFSSCFCAHFKLTPSQYRRSLK